MKHRNNMQLKGWTATWKLMSPQTQQDGSKRRRRKVYSVVGSPDYMAVEILTQTGYTNLVDFWSLGVMLYEFVFGFTPFGAETPEEVFQNVQCVSILSTFYFYFFLITTIIY